MSEIATAWVALVPSMKNFGSTMTRQVGGEVDSAGRKISSRLGGALKVGFLAGGVALAAFGKSAVGAASDAQQSIGATETVFGKFAKTVIKTSSEAATAYGLSANEYRENANLLGALFKNQGLDMDQLGVSTEKMIGRAADLAATFGGPTSDAVAALGSAFKGEFDNLERFGISLRESTVSALLAKRGQDDLTGSALAAAKQQAITSLIFRQSSDSMGAFGRESNTLAGQQQRLGAQFENIKAVLGEALLPILTRLATFITTSVLPPTTKFIDQMRSGKGEGGEFARALENLWEALSGVATFIVDHKKAFVTLATVIGTITVAVKAWTAAQILLNIALWANPIGVVIGLTVGLAAGLLILHQRSERFRKAVSALNAVMGVAIGVVERAAKAVAGFGAMVVGNAVPAVMKLANGIQGALGGALSGVISAIGNAVGALSRFGTSLTSALGAAGRFAAGVAGKFQGIISAIQSVIGWVSALIDKIQSIPGIPGGSMKASGTWVGPVPGASGKASLTTEIGAPSLSYRIPQTPLAAASGGGAVVVEMGPKTLRAMAGMDAAAAREFGREINGAAARAARAR